MRNLRAAVWCLIAAAVATFDVAAARAAEASRERFGALADGTEIESVTLASPSGVSARVMTLGATLQSLMVPDRDGHADDIVLGYDTPAEYLANPQYFGATVGRFANRVAHGRFSLDGHDIGSRPMTAPTICTAACAASTRGCGRSARWLAARWRALR